MPAPHRIIYIIGFVAVACLCVLTFASTAPTDFPDGTMVTIPSGTTLGQAAALLQTDGVVRSGLIYRGYATLLGGTGGIKSGSYLFAGPQSALRIADRMVRGDSGLPLVKVVIPEGTDTADMAKIFAAAIPGFASTTFLGVARPLEGYLFPDTYYFTSADTAATIVSAMQADFTAKIATIHSQIASSGHDEHDIVTMASIVEREASSTVDRKLIAGILWKRIADGIPLEVDRPFYYLFGKTSAELTDADLKTDSPYNLYLHTGLPPTPIDSPGLDALEDTADPTPSPYLYYLSDSNGVMHYASTLAGHIANRNKYIN